MKKVILESPYAGDIRRNVHYARLCMHDSLMRNEAPIASHLLYTQPNILDDNILIERDLGINAGLLWGEKAELTVAYTDFGISRGMQYGIDKATLVNREIEFRKLFGGFIVENSEFSLHNKSAIQDSEFCACYYCEKYFSPREISCWVDINNDTPLCPYCGTDTIVGSAQDPAISDPTIIRNLHNFFFDKESWY
tara:strand:+ start:23000 stop:23581 length:582 start_codon:yes stop_codon:yes gene_type:complete